MLTRPSLTWTFASQPYTVMLCALYRERACEHAKTHSGHIPLQGSESVLDVSWTSSWAFESLSGLPHSLALWCCAP